MIARSAVNLLGTQANSVMLFYRKIREMIVCYLEQHLHDYFGGSIELDEGCFGGHRKGKRGRGAAGKVAVLGIFKTWWRNLYTSGL